MRAMLDQLMGTNRNGMYLNWMKMHIRQGLDLYKHSFLFFLHSRDLSLSKPFNFSTIMRQYI